MELSRRALLAFTGVVGVTGTLTRVQAGTGNTDGQPEGRERGTYQSVGDAARFGRAETTAIETSPYSLGQMTKHDRNDVDLVDDLVSLAEGGHVLVGSTDAAGGADVWLVRITPDGMAVWNHTYGPERTERALAGTQDLSGDVVVTGFSIENRVGSTGLFARVTADGEPSVRETYRLGGNARLHDLALANDGTYRLVGWTANRPDAPIQPVVVRVRPDGRLVSSTRYSVPDVGVFTTVVPVAGDGALAAGWFVNPVYGGRKALLVRIDADDRERWRRFDLMPADGTITTGVHRSDDSFVVSGVVKRGETSVRSWVIGIDPVGSTLWTNRITDERMIAETLVPMPSGDVLLAGFWNQDTPSVWIGRFATDGTVAWSGAFGPREGSSVAGIDVRPPQKLVVAGNTLSDEDTQDAFRMILEKPNQPPRATISVQPERAVVGSRVRFDPGASSDQDGEIVRYEWDLDDDGEFETEGEVVHKRFTEPGEKHVRLRVFDDEGRRGVARATVTILGEDENLTVTDPADNGGGDVGITVPGFGIGGALVGTAGVAAYRFVRARRRERREEQPD